MGKIEEGEVTWTCSRGHLWPPIAIIAHGDEEGARANVVGIELHKLDVWSSACGQLQMSPAKCKTCPYVEKNGVLVVKPGGKAIRPVYVKSKRTK